MKKISSLQKKLKSYSLFAGSMLAITQVQGQIVYTNLNPDEEIGGVIPSSFPYYDSYGLDMNNDGIVDFNINLDINGLTGFDPSQLNYLEIISGVIPGNQAGASNQTFPPFTFDDISSGHLINSVGIGGWVSSARLGWNTNSQAGLPYPDVDHLFALRFLINNETHYGWIRLANNTRQGATPDTINMVVRDYAYNSVANEAILAGQTPSNINCDVYEPNDQFVDPTVISTNEIIQAAINPSGDKDFFKFNVNAAAPNVRILLFDLPKNYDIALFTHNHVRLGISRNLQKVRDTIIYNNASARNYFIKVYQKDDHFDPACYSLIVETSATPFKMEIEEADVSTPGFEIYPNPFSSIATIEFDLDEPSPVSIRLFSIDGKEVATIADENFSDGNHQLTLNRESLSAGIYFLEMKTNEGMVTEKLIVE